MMVRAARPKDLDQLFKLGKEFYASSPQSRKFEFDENGFLFFLFNNIQNSVFLVAEEEGVIKGAIMGCAVTIPGTVEQNLVETNFFVSEKDRNGGVGRALITEFENIAIQKGCVNVALEASSGINNEEVYKKFEKMGYKPFGIIFIKEIE